MWQLLDALGFSPGAGVEGEAEVQARQQLRLQCRSVFEEWTLGTFVAEFLYPREIPKQYLGGLELRELLMGWPCLGRYSGFPQL